MAQKEVVVYFDLDLDQDLLDYLTPFLRRKRGSDEIRELMRRALYAGQGGGGSYYQGPLMPSARNEAEIQADLESDVDAVEKARAAQLATFGDFGFDES